MTQSQKFSPSLGESFEPHSGSLVLLLMGMSWLACLTVPGMPDSAWDA